MCNQDSEKAPGYCAISAFGIKGQTLVPLLRRNDNHISEKTPQDDLDNTTEWVTEKDYKITDGDDVDMKFSKSKPKTSISDEGKNVPIP